MNVKRTYYYAVVLMLALMSNQLHQWQPHAEDSVCDVCLLASDTGVVPEATDIHIQIAEKTLHDWTQYQSQHTNEPSLIEPIRGSPALS